MEKYLLLVFAVLVAFTRSCYGQKFSPGFCSSSIVSSTTPAMKIDSLAGTWREYARTTSIDRHSWHCTTWSVAKVTTNRFTLQIGGKNKLTTTLLRSGGDIVVNQATVGATVTKDTYFTITMGAGFITKNLNYYVVAVDKDEPTYMILYTCENVVFGKMENAILLVKDAVTLANLRAALNKMEEAGFPSPTLKFNYQGDCVSN